MTRGRSSRTWPRRWRWAGLPGRYRRLAGAAGAGGAGGVGPGGVPAGQVAGRGPGAGGAGGAGRAGGGAGAGGGGGGAGADGGLVTIDLDATIVIAHSEKQEAAPTWKKTFGLLTELPGAGSHFRGGVGFRL